jgi:spore coat protein A
MQSRSGISRRQALKLGAVGGATVLVSGGVFGALKRASSPPTQPLPVAARFAAPLPIPPVLRPARSDADADYYELTEQEARVSILPGVQTTVWGFNGSFPGPTIVARRGRRAVVRVTNRLPAPAAPNAAYVCGNLHGAQGLPAPTPGALAAATSTHLHGGVTPADSDGFPTDLVLPGASKDYVYPNEQRAATLWYHDHAMDTTAYHTYMGLAGMYIVRDGAEERLPLPSADYDVPLILQDRQFAADGSFSFSGNRFSADGATMLVNGAPWPRMEVAARKYRFRLLNASNSRAYTLALSSGRPITQIATDGGLLAAPVSTPTLPLAMAERAEVVIDFAEYPVGSQVVLQNRADQGPMGEVMRFDVVRAARDDSSVPAKLADVEPLRPEQAVRERTFVFAGSFTRAHGLFPPMAWTINGKEFDPSRVDAAPRLGDVEIWRLVNHNFGPLGGDHPVHVHLVNFQILERDGRKPGIYERGWKDTVFLKKGEEARVIMRFAGYKGKYMLHCHNLQHEDCAMMTTYQTV